LNASGISSGKFSTPIRVNYVWSSVQAIHISLRDAGTSDRLEIANAQRYLAAITTAPRSTVRVPMGSAQMTIEAIQVDNVNGADPIRFQFCGKGLKKMDLFGKSDPYYEISHILPHNQQEVVVYRSEHLEKNLDPTWLSSPTMPLKRILPWFNLDREDLVFRCFDHNNPVLGVERHSTAMGSFRFSIQQLINVSQGRRENKWLLRDDKGADYGTISLKSLYLAHCPSAIDHLAAGLKLNLFLAIDFTYSNKSWREPGSNHTLQGGTATNPYMRAITSAGKVLEQYVGDPEIALFGFGACPPGTNKVSHCFPLTFDDAKPTVTGIEGVLETYKDSVTKLNFVGPTYVTPVLEKAQEMAAAKPGTFSVVLILMDDPPGDEWVDDWLRDNHKAPMSVIFVNVVGCDVGMSSIDGDLPPIAGPQDRGSTARDMVNTHTMPLGNAETPQQLAQSLLNETPLHIVTWGMVNNIVPPAFQVTPPITFDLP
jgi:hypothetical protein